MAQGYRPGPAPATVTEHEHERMMAPLLPNGLIGPPSSQPLVYADSTGLHVKVAPNREAWVRGSLWWTDGDGLTVPISENAESETRYDRVVLRLDRSDWSVSVAVVEGVPGGGEPSVTQDPGPSGVYEVRIATVTVAPGATTIHPADVQPWQTYVGSLPIVVAEPGEASTDGLPWSTYLRYAPSRDQLLLVTPAGSHMLWWDTGWVDLGAAASGWTATQPSYIRRVGHQVTLVLGNFQRTGGNIASGTHTRLLPAIPADFRYSGPQSIDFAAHHSSGPQTVRLTLYRTVSSTGRHNQLWITDHSGIQTGQSVRGTTITWSV